MEEGKNDLAREADLAKSGERFQFGHICFIRVCKARPCVHTGYFLNHQTNSYCCHMSKLNPLTTFFAVENLGTKQG